VQDAPIRQDNGQPEHVVTGNAIFQAARTTGIAGDVTANGGVAVAGWVRGVEQTLFFDNSLQVGSYNTGLHMSGGIHRVDFQDTVHARQRQYDPTLERHCSSSQTRTHAARHQRQARYRGDTHSLADLLGCAREQHQVGAVVFEGTVKAVNCQVFWAGQHAVLTDGFFKLDDERWVDHRLFLRR